MVRTLLVLAVVLLTTGGVPWGAPRASAAPVGVPPAAGTTTGTLVAWGDNQAGQSTVPAGLGLVTAVSAGGFTTAAVRSDGTPVIWGSNSYGQTNMPAGLTGIVALSSDTHTLALRSNGTVVGWGHNYNGQATPPAGLTGVVAVAVGSSHSLALTSAGTVVAWGYNGDGQTSVPTGLTGVTAIAAAGQYSLALRSDGTVAAWGANGRGQTLVPTGLTGVTAIAAGYWHALALKSDGTVVAWGDSSYGATAVPSGLSGVTAVAAGSVHSVALKSDGTVAVWGSNGQNQRAVPAGLDHVLAIAAGGGFTLAIRQPSAPTWTADSPPASATVGSAYSATFAASGRPAPTYAVTSGSLPPGLSLDSTTGALSGTPTVVGTSTFTVTASNGVSPAAPGAPHTIVVAPPPPGSAGSVTATAGTAQVNATWTAPTTGGPVDHYAVTASTGATCTSTGLTCRLGAPAGSAPTVTVTPVGPTGLTGPDATATAGTVLAPAVGPNPPGGAADLASTAGTTLNPGQTTQLTATGFLGSSAVTLVLHSPAVVLGTAVSTGSGTLSASVTVPAGVALGPHTLVAYGVGPSGGTVQRSVSVIVTPLPPGSPGQVVATAGIAQVLVTWTAAGTGGPVDHYTVTASTGARCTSTDTSCRLGAPVGSSPTVAVTAVGPTGLRSTALAFPVVAVPGPVAQASAPTSGPLLAVVGGATTLTPGQEIRLTATGYLANSAVILVVHSTPRQLGTTTADSGGTVDASVALPADLESGMHTIVAYGVDPSGNPYLRRLPISVAEAPTGSPTPPGSTSHALAGTGPAAVVPLTGAALVLLLTGGIGLAAARRRRG